ncbi:MAG TPA: arsenite methyltransferase [Bacteroidia bacterium]|nr:arsenite methyltransferase [Bacteroidia bacterium]
MQTTEDIKKMVREKYTEIATQDKETNASSCCGSTCCSDEVYHLMADDYSKMEGYEPGADLGLGCGLPTEFAKIRKGDVVIDLGSGAGNDCFVARAETGESGKVIGIDMTEAMIDLARKNAEKLGYNNVEFRLGDIEKMPVTSAIADVVVSNCVLNLVPDKQKAISEIHRVLKPGGHFSISDIVLKGTLPPALLRTAEMYAGCISGAIQKEAYLAMVKNAGFENVQVQKEKPIHVPDDILKQYLSEAELAEYKSSGVGIFSITVYAGKKNEPCCDPADKCC